MSKKSGYPCSHCGHIAYTTKFPKVCPECGEVYRSSIPTFYHEPFPEIDPKFLEAKKAAEEAANRPPVEESLAPEKAAEAPVIQGDKVKYCPICHMTFPVEQRRCAKCNRPLFERAREAVTPEPKAQGQPASSHVTEMKLRLSWGGGEIILLATGEKKLLGRLSNPELPKTVSSRHLFYYLDGGELFLQDNGSTNGTYVDGIKLAANVPHRVNELDKGFLQLGLGQHTILKVTKCA